MNGMNFKPFIHRVLDSLSDADIKTFAELIDTHSNSFTNRSLVAGNLTSEDKGVGLFTIELGANTIRTGYLLFNDDYCVLLGYVSNSERIIEYKINVTNNTYEVVKEYLTTDYLRQAVAVKAVEAGELGNLVEFIEVNNIENMSDDELNGLHAGDVVIKKTGNQKHTYVVTYKENKHGICMSYVAAGYMETVSYDYTAGHWVYNSKDVLSIPMDLDPAKTYTLKVVGGVITAVEDE